MRDGLLTVQCQHGGNSLAVRYSSWIRYAVFPQVGVVVWCCQDHVADFRPGPDICWHCGADQNPSTHTYYKAAYLHVHHHGPITHYCFRFQHQDRLLTNLSSLTQTTVHFFPELSSLNSLLTCWIEEGMKWHRPPEEVT